MKQFTTFILLFITTLTFAQNKLHFGVQLNGNFTTGIPTSNNYPAEYYKGIETFSFSYSGGGTLAYDLADKFSLQSGLLFRKSGDKSGVFPPDPFRSFSLRLYYNKYGLEMPLNVKYALSEKFKIILGASVAYNFFSKYLYNDEISTYNVAFKGNEINPLDLYGNLGIEYNLTDQFSITAYSQFDVLKTQYDYLVFYNSERNYLSLGLNFGYRFN